MARIAGVDLPSQKNVEIALTYIFGIGRSRSTSILGKANVPSQTKVRDLAEEEVRKIRQVIQEEGQVEGDPRRREILAPVRLPSFLPLNLCRMVSSFSIDFPPNQADFPLSSLTLIPKESPISPRISLISLRDFLPKFLVFSISPSDFWTRSAIVRMSAPRKQL